MFSYQEDLQNTQQDPDWLALFDDLDVRFLMLDTHQDCELLQAVQRNPRWALDVEDGDSALFVRARLAA
ncbi:MAG: hypothetical protein ACK2U9_02855 [Anaerolineae bacterium]|jgi:hypothetical protein